MATLNHILSMWEVVLDNLGRTSVCWKGTPLSEKDTATFTEAIVMCAIHLTDLSNRYDGIGSTRDLVAWAHLCVSLDVHELGSFLSEAIENLRHVAEPIAYNRFKRLLARKYPFVGAFLAPIRGVLTSFLEDPNPRGFYVCYQFLSFLTHLTLVDINIDLEGEYEEMEHYLQSRSYPSTMIMEMNSIMREWMSDFVLDESNFIPQHGPGAAAEVTRRAGVLKKYRYLGTDALINYVFSKHAGIDITTYFPHPPQMWRRRSKLVFVPKSMKTRRAISKEPVTLQYLQQGVQRVIVDYIHKHPFLSRHIDLRDQELNAQMAISSSLSHQMATIDLSSASDTVTVELVKAVFRGTPLYPYLVALRSSEVELPSGKVLRVAKFAPMGSALCFPIETLIFACAVEYTVRRAHRSHLGFFPKWRVYGDDIIVQDALFWDTLLTLGGLGFITNTSKSFSSPARFRESCGGEGYDGVDVTPMRISRNFYSVRNRWTSSHAPLFEELIEMANSCHHYGFSLLRAWIIRVLLGNPLGPPLFSGEGLGALYSPVPDNYRANRRVNTRFFETEVEVVMSGSRSPKKKELDPDLEQSRLFETLRLLSLREGDVFLPEDCIQVPRGPGRPILQKRWVISPNERFGCLVLLNTLQD